MNAAVKKFYKYQGAGNDFVIVEPEFFGLENKRTDSNTFSEEEKILIVPQVIELCHRNFGIGADGYLIVSKIG
jgi:diaminopimelate epimerase